MLLSSQDLRNIKSTVTFFFLLAWAWGSWGVTVHAPRLVCTLCAHTLAPSANSPWGQSQKLRLPGSLRKEVFETKWVVLPSPYLHLHFAKYHISTDILELGPFPYALSAVYLFQKYFYSASIVLHSVYNCMIHCQTTDPQWIKVCLPKNNWNYLAQGADLAQHQLTDIANMESHWMCKWSGTLVLAKRGP